MKRFLNQNLWIINTNYGKMLLTESTTHFVIYKSYTVLHNKNKYFLTFQNILFLLFSYPIWCFKVIISQVSPPLLPSAYYMKRIRISN